MSGILWLLLLLQDPVEQQIDESLRRFEAADEVGEALTLLSSQLTALGARAADPLARRLAAELRDGVASAAAPAFVDALAGRPDALAPLQAAFRDATTSAAGRLSLAEALLQLEDALSWRGGLLAIAGDGKASLPDRLRSVRLLLQAEDPGAPGLLRSLVAELPAAPEARQREVVDFLLSLDGPAARELLRSIAEDRRLPAAVRASARPRPSARATPEDPAERVIDASPRRAPPPGAGAVKKRETAEETSITLPTILAGGGTLVLLALLAAEVLRKG